MFMHKMQDEMLEWLQKMRSDHIADDSSLRDLLAMPLQTSRTLSTAPHSPSVQQRMTNGVHHQSSAADLSTKDGIISGPIDAYDQALLSLNRSKAKKIQAPGTSPHDPNLLFLPPCYQMLDGDGDEREEERREFLEVAFIRQWIELELELEHLLQQKFDVYLVIRTE